MLDQAKITKLQKSRDYRASYIAARVRLAIASQIRALREQFSSTQAEFAQLIGKPQSVVSRLENPEYGKMSVQTLLEVAEELDITLVVKFMSYDDFFDLLDDRNLVPNALRVEPFSETTRRYEREAEEFKKRQIDKLYSSQEGRPLGGIQPQPSLIGKSFLKGSFFDQPRKGRQLENRSYIA